MNPILWPGCVCSPELAQRIPELLERKGYSIRSIQPKALPRGRKLEFMYVLKDGPRRISAVGIRHHARDEIIVRFHPLPPGFRLDGFFGREKFAFAVIRCLVRHGATKTPLPPEGKLRHLAKNGDPHQARYARMMLKALAREKKRLAKR